MTFGMSVFVLWEKKERVLKVFNEWNKLASKTDNIGTIFHTKHAAAHTNHQLYIHKVKVYEATKLVSLCMSMCQCFDP